MAIVRMIVTDVDAAVAFWRDHFGFALKEQYGPAMAIVTGQGLELWLAGPPASASKPMPDGARPEPGGWTRPVILVEDLPAIVARLKAAGVRFRNTLLKGPGGSQILCLDPCGNIIELFEPA